MMGESSGGEDSVVRSQGFVYRFYVTSSRIYVQGPRHCCMYTGFGTYDTRIDGVPMLQVIQYKDEQLLTRYRG